MSFDFNQISLMGNVARTPEQTFTQGGKPRVTTAIAVGKPIGDETMFINLTIYNEKLGAWFLANVDKGTRLLVSGQLVIDTKQIETAEGTKNQYYVSVLVNQAVFAGAKRTQEDSDQPVRVKQGQETTADLEDLFPPIKPVPAQRVAAAAAKPAPTNRPVPARTVNTKQAPF